MKDEYNLKTEQLKFKENRLNELEAMAYDINHEAQLRAENSEISRSLRQASDAANEYRSQVSFGKGVRTRLDQENEQLRETMRYEESATQAKMRGAELYHNNIITSKDGQAQTLRDQEQQLPKLNPRKNRS